MDMIISDYNLKLKYNIITQYKLLFHETLYVKWTNSLLNILDKI